MTFYAHTKEDSESGLILPKEQWQLLEDHLHAVEKLAEANAEKFGAGKLGRIIGRVHDIGKYSVEFQQRLEGSNKRVDHATAGAQVVCGSYPGIGRALAFPIAGHHGGLPDGQKGAEGNLPERLERKDITDYSAYSLEIELPELTNSELARMPRAKKGMEAFSYSFCIRMLYSCLVDADYMDTERFMNAGKSSFRPGKADIKELFNRFEMKLKQLTVKNEGNPTPINQARQKILQRCLEMAGAKPGFFTLTVPTGGGKTYSSLAFGLKHSVEHQKDRIIYVIPYTSIIEQNAEVFRDALGYDNVVLEHHSNFDYPEGSFDDWKPEEKTHRLASENWDMPVVVTTAVQFFESLYANKGSKCRKLHNMANSVIILDEAQMMPMEYLKPCLWALAELVLNYNSTVVFCTATQPAIKDVIPEGVPVVEIMEDPKGLYQIFKRVRTVTAGSLSDSILAKKMAEMHQVLTIVNTRKHARLLYDHLLNEGATDTIHLSARMCPTHRKEILAEIRQRLKDGEVCKVVSTQLIEAGVDVDFPFVFRSAAGIDSIAQAAGRCNREGRLREGEIVVFEPEPHGMPSKGGFEASAAMMRSTVRRLELYDGDLLSLKAIEFYFSQMMDLHKNDLDAKGILKTIHDTGAGMSFSFAQIAQDFQFIDSEMVPIIIPWNDTARKIMQGAEASLFPASKARSLQPYVVQIYRHELPGFEKEGVIHTVGGFMKFLTDTSFYDFRYGLKDPKEVFASDKIFIL